jgi:hypothetical protein
MNLQGGDQNSTSDETNTISQPQSLIDVINSVTDCVSHSATWHWASHFLFSLSLFQNQISVNFKTTCDVESLPESIYLRKEAHPDLPLEDESVRVLVIGSRDGVNRIIKTLDRLNFARSIEWSPFMPGSKPGEVMRILLRYITEEEMTEEEE